MFIHPLGKPLPVSIFSLLLLVALAFASCKVPAEDDPDCCRVCTESKACGDSCINKALTCNQPKGCACNG